MPFVSFTTNHKLTLKQENTITEKTGKLIELIPGKAEKSLMIHLEDNQIMYFQGKELPCMMIAVSLYHEAPYEAKKNFVEALTQMIKETTNIDVDNIYVKFTECDNWGKNGTLV